MVRRHDIVLRGLSLTDSKGSPLILERTESDFVTAMLDDLQSDSRGQAIEQTIARQTDTKYQCLKLFQPVHRTMHLALLEAACETLGDPRLDPNRIESAGLVLRRRAQTGGGFEGWLSSKESKLKGWVPLSSGQIDIDPDWNENQRGSAGNAEIDRLLSLRRSVSESPAAMREDFTPLFTAPPDICEAARRTILYAVIPLASTEQNEDSLEPPSFPSKDIEAHLSILLKSPHEKTASNSNCKWLGGTYDAEQFANVAGADALNACLQQVHVELDAFGDSKKSEQLFAALNSIRLPFSGRSERGAGDFLKEATEKLLLGEPGQVQMPTSWPGISPADRNQVIAVAKAAMEERFAGINPGEGRFDPIGRKYSVRGFIRLKREGCCAPQLVWSDYSEPFVISQWYDGNAAVPPVQLTLPDPTEAGFLESLKPNVAVQMSGGMFDLLDKLGMSEVSKLLKGEDPGVSSGGGGVGIGWICSFNISIVFIIAIFLMFMFMLILNIFFAWKFFFKICIPYPKPE